MDPTNRGGRSSLEPSDAELVARVRSGTVEAFGLLVRRHRHVVHGLIGRRVPQPANVEDLGQETFVQAFLGLDKLADPSSFRSWVCGIALNLCRNWWRRAARETAILRSLATDDNFFSSAEMAAEQALEVTILDGLTAVAADRRRALELFYLEDLSLREVARRLDTTMPAVKSRLHKGRRELRQHLEPAFPRFGGGRTRTPTPSAIQRRSAMVSMRVTHTVPFQSKLLVLLADDRREYAVPLWLPLIDSLDLVLPTTPEPEVPDPSASHPRGIRRPPAELRSAVDLAARLLAAAGAEISGFRLLDLGDDLQTIELIVTGGARPAGVKVSLADGLALAHLQSMPIEVPDHLAEHVSRLPIETQQDDTPGAAASDALDGIIPGLAAAAGIPARSAMDAEGRQRRPINLDFEHGLQRWALRGDFLHSPDRSRWTDYEATSGEGSARLRATSLAVEGFAELRQAVLADDYRGQVVTFNAEVRSEGRPQAAELYVRSVVHARSGPSSQRTATPLGESGDWTAQQVSHTVPGEATFLLFGLRLNGPGDVRLRRLTVERAPKPG